MKKNDIVIAKLNISDYIIKDKSYRLESNVDKDGLVEVRCKDKKIRILKSKDFKTVAKSKKVE